MLPHITSLQVMGPEPFCTSTDNPKRILWETRFTSYLDTLDKGLHKAILPADGDDDDDFNTKNKWAYAELVQVLDERSLKR